MSEIIQFLSENEIRDRVAKLGESITRDFSDKNMLVVGVLNGAFVFTSDLARSINCPMQIDFVRVSSYEGDHSTGRVKLDLIPKNTLKGKDVLLIEDIVDTGRTLSALKKVLEESGAKSVKIAVFLDKPSRRVVELKPDYCCFEIPDKFVVGYGLDFDEKYRNLPFVGVITNE